MDLILPQGADSLQGDEGKNAHSTDVCPSRDHWLPTAAGLELLQAEAEPARSPEPAQCLVPVLKNACQSIRWGCRQWICLGDTDKPQWEVRRKAERDWTLLSVHYLIQSLIKQADKVGMTAAILQVRLSNFPKVIKLVTNTRFESSSLWYFTAVLSHLPVGKIWWKGGLWTKAGYKVS